MRSCPSKTTMSKADLSNKQNGPELLSDTRVVVHLPDKIGIELVQANELRHYEHLNWLITATSSFAVGFWTAIMTDLKNASGALWGSAIAFTAMTGIFVGFAIYYRKKVYHHSVTKSLFLRDFKPDEYISNPKGR